MFVMVDGVDEMADMVEISGCIQQNAVFRFQAVQRKNLIEDAVGRFGYVAGVTFIHSEFASRPLDGNRDLLIARDEYLV